MTSPNADYERVIKRTLAGVQLFADDMREQGIHVGLGNPGRCVTCGEDWPCPDSLPPNGRSGTP